ncbi:hypothetical protein [Silvanigrella paludirubra]|uniref:hypothetical protein n=1 Tax=Silvanigrella paludirubra TaxID=2499159 RepID=UPI0012975D1E|nr:hypothetical protein [Silvanigrella paludirubra]
MKNINNYIIKSEVNIDENNLEIIYLEELEKKLFKYEKTINISIEDSEIKYNK